MKRGRCVGTVTGVCSVLIRSHILIAGHIYWLCVAYISSLYKLYMKFPENTNVASIKHIYQLYRTYITFVPLAPQASSRIAPRTITVPKLTPQAAVMVAA